MNYILSIFMGCSLVITLVIIVGARASVRVRPGEVVAFHLPGSRRVESIYSEPGWHWRRARWDAPLRLWVDESVDVTSRPVEARTHDNASVIVTARLIMDVTDPKRYVTAVVEEEFRNWQEAVLPILIAQVVSGYSVTQVLNDRGRVAQSIASEVAAWFADNSTQGFGLAFKSAAIISANRPPIPRD